ncbi:MAG: hypothetical protein JWM99_2191 [Verrucomicrobiales bacterium]|jgi:hypothetical protein|nr:hypothetical protein [Verrucomicrobiales bacterium]
MNAIEFTADLTGADSLAIPTQIASQLPKAGKARVILLVKDQNDDKEWYARGYEQFLTDDSTEDSVYDALR